MKNLRLQPPYVKVIDRFYPQAKILRNFFDEQFKDPRQAHEGRFVWDYWNVPDQYCHLRTPAYHYFPQEDYAAFHETLVHWGREHLGCHDISPPWLSCYPAGSFQSLHKDEPHGPLAFVFSLTKDLKSFTGGRTLIATKKEFPAIGRKREIPQRAEKVLKSKISVEPKFNRLTVFDPSFPHGVSTTKGSLDPRFSRLVIHGWFIQPRPFWEGPLTLEEVHPPLQRLVERISELKEMRKREGYLGLRFSISKQGRVQKMRVLVSTLGDFTSSSEIAKLGREELSFAPQAEESSITLPLMFLG